MLRARSADYLLAMSAASASLPVIGKHLEPLGGDPAGRFPVALTVRFTISP